MGEMSLHIVRSLQIQAGRLISSLTDLEFKTYTGRTQLRLFKCSSFDTVKTRIQCATPGTYSGAFDVLFKIVRNEVCLISSPTLSIFSYFVCL